MKIAPLNEGRGPYVRWWYRALRRDGCTAAWAYYAASTLADTYWTAEGKEKWDLTATHERAQQEAARARAGA